MNSIPRGLAIFLCGIVIVIALVWGYVAFFGNRAASSANGSGATSFFSSLFPFGNYSPSAKTGASASNSGALSSGGTGGGGAVPVLRQIGTGAVSGGWFTEGGSAGAPSILYMDRESGHITETPANSFTETRVSNTTIPGIQELYGIATTTVILRSLTDTGGIENFFGTVNATSSEESLNVTPLPAFDRMSVDATGTHMLTVAPVNGGSQIVFSNPDGTNAESVFASPITSWVPMTEAGRIFLETAPTAAAPGYLYEIRNGALAKVAGGVNGFASLISPSAGYVAYSGDTSDGFSLAVLDTKTNQTFTSPIGAFAMKCAWVPNHEPLLFCAVPANPVAGAYPDDWLMGNTSFSDNGWILDPVHSTSYFIGALTDTKGAPIDAENVSVDPTGSYALFMNKNDLSLWSLKIGDVVARVLSL